MSDQKPKPDTARSREDNEREFRKNFSVKCMNCDQVPTVGDTGLCGPCCFGDASTVGGDW